MKTHPPPLSETQKSQKKSKRLTCSSRISLVPYFLIFTLTLSLAITSASFLVNHNYLQYFFPAAARPPVKRATVIVDVMHGMSDEELFRKAASSMDIVGPSFEARRNKKVAFLFLTRGSLPLGPLWERFFAGKENDGLYSVYVHPSPSFNWSAPEGSVFHGRRIPSQKVEWGGLSVVDAERRLLANALLDMSNERFVLLSESCIPLRPFPEVYSYLLNSTTTFVHSFDERRGHSRYRPGMAAAGIRPDQWRKGSQWFEVDRSLALAIVADNVCYPVFFKHCPAARSCIPDEHYLPTLLNMIEAGGNANRSLTWVDWSRRRAHPKQYGGRNKVDKATLEYVRGGGGGGRNCSYNGKDTDVCFLFARKFLPDTLAGLLELSKSVLGF